jgi:hypothetical protein
MFRWTNNFEYNTSFPPYFFKVINIFHLLLKIGRSIGIVRSRTKGHGVLLKISFIAEGWAEKCLELSTPHLIDADFGSCYRARTTKHSLRHSAAPKDTNSVRPFSTALFRNLSLRGLLQQYLLNLCFRLSDSNADYQEANKQFLKRRMVSSGMLRGVGLIRTDISEELSASFIRVTKIGELGTTLAVTSNRRTLRRYTSNLTNNSYIECYLMSSGL